MSPTSNGRSAAAELAGPAALEQLGPELDELHRATGAPVTARRPWLQAWVRAYSAAEPWVVVVRDPSGRRLDGAALLCRRPAGGVVEVAALGYGRNDRGRLPARTPAAAQALAEAVVLALAALDRPWTLRLEQLPAGDPVAAAIVDCLDVAWTVPGGPVPRVAFTAGADLDTYLGKGMRKQLRKARNRMVLEGLAPAMAFHGDPAAVTALLAEVERTHRARDHAVGRASDIDSSANRQFWREVILDHAARGQVEIGTLRLGTELAAYVIALLDGDSYRVMDGRFATQSARFSPGRVLESEAIARALADPRFRELDWMNSIASEKLVAANDLEPTQHVVACSPSLLARITREAARIVVDLDETVRGRPTAEPALTVLLGRA